MPMLTTGFNKIRDFHSTVMTHIEVGTGTNEETLDDTDLQTPVASSEVLVDSSTKTSQQVVKQGTLSSTVGVGSSVTELIWKKDSTELAHSRITHTAIAHTNAENIIYETRWFYRQ
tara:strand:+ start:71 stop:418 length:348 start_codon:yes stop_codon:yes gene_type:complete